MTNNETNLQAARQAVVAAATAMHKLLDLPAWKCPTCGNLEEIPEIMTQRQVVQYMQAEYPDRWTWSTLTLAVNELIGSGYLEWVDAPFSFKRRYEPTYD